MTALDTTLHEMATPRRGLLSKAMLVNATVSGISGAGLALGAPALDEWLGLNMWVLVGVGGRPSRVCNRPQDLGSIGDMVETRRQACRCRRHRMGAG